MDFLRFEFRPLLSKSSTKRHRKQFHIVPMLCKRQKATKKWINVQSIARLHVTSRDLLVVKNESISVLWELNSIFM